MNPTPCLDSPLTTKMAEPDHVELLPPGGQQPTDGYSGSMPPPEAGASQQQSAQQAWRREPFFWTDQASTATFSELPERHISGTRVQQTVVETGHELHQITTSAFRSLLGDVDYDAFLNGLLYPGEKPQLPPPHQFVDYGAVVMSVGDKGTDNYHVLHELPPGRCMLTSSRLIFLSSTAHTSNTLQAYGDPKLKTLKTGGYTVSSSARDTRLFYPLPLSAFLTVRLGVNSGVVTTSHVVATAPCCKWRMCCSCCIKQWTPSPPQVGFLALVTCDCRLARVTGSCRFVYSGSRMFCADLLDQ